MNSSMNHPNWARMGTLICGLLFVGCGVHTRLAVHNASDAPVTAAVTSGEQTTTFDDVAPSTTSEFQVVDYNAAGASVETPSGSQNVTLVEGEDNTVSLGSGEATVQSVENPDNSYWKP